MIVWLWALVGILTLIVIAALTKIHILRKAAREIEEAFADRLQTSTNTPIGISCNDRYMRSLAAAINTQLRRLRSERHRFQQGDTELKNAVTNISHDIRTPLTAICGYLDLLEQVEKPDDVERYLDIIRNRSEMLMHLTEELFRYSVILSGEKDPGREPVVINHVLEESIAAFYAALQERHITPGLRIPEERIVRILDRSALSRVFSNLLNNAINYSDGDLDIILRKTGEIIFVNTAAGLDEVQVGRLFNRFFTVEAARKSTGLGLAITKALVEQMGGTVSAEYEGNRLSIRIAFPGAGA
nr:HAMP domain-containing sensor histidine kinase [uncultured Acetatifactor sp.]